jgi:hypothetical protein
MKNFILIQLKRQDGTTITTFDGEPQHAVVLKDQITNIYINESGGQTIWIEIIASNI